MIIFLFWIAFAVLVGVYANSKGRSGVGFAVLSLFISPLLGFLIALAAKSDPKAVEAAQLQTGQMKKCPRCAEIVKAEAIVCRFCGTELPAVQTPAPASPPVMNAGERMLLNIPPRVFVFCILGLVGAYVLLLFAVGSAKRDERAAAVVVMTMRVTPAGIDVSNDSDQALRDCVITVATKPAQFATLDAHRSRVVSYRAFAPTGITMDIARREPTASARCSTEDAARTDARVYWFR